MAEALIDREARLRIDRVENNQRDLEHALASLQRDQAVTAEVLRGVVDAQSRLLAKLDKDDEKVRGLELGAAATKVRWAILGGIGMLLLAALVNQVGLI